ncbi:restriction endonuclease subunit S [Mesorhizobium sp. B3-1-7]|uniref:restriction endonuclease subunit S n=1 Tax=Mesorhizobium sp. B3-1-7 TaxID=2589894 RepID=UPI001FF02AB7|nr:restriction endonuclease subunit S [Mesorhizobium sp. B3-1-7]
MVPDDKANASKALPAGWRWTTIGEHYRFKNGLNKAKRFFGHGTPIINYMDVFNHQRLRADDVQGKVTVTADETKNYSAKQGDAFFTRTSETVSEIGMASVLVEQIDKAVFSGFVLRGRPINGDLDPQFAAFALRARDVRKQIELRATYTTRALTNGRSLSEVTFPLPGKDERHDIAQALTDIDELIAALDTLVAKKRAIRQGAMQQLLTGKRRLRSFSEEWKMRKVGELAKCLRGVSYKGDTDLRESSGPATRTLLRSNNILEGRLTFDDVQYVVQDRVKDKQLLRKGDILLCMANGSKALVGKSALIEADFDGLTFGAFMGCVRPENPDEGAFLHLLFQSHAYRLQIADALSGSSINNLAPSQVEGLAFGMPDADERIEIAHHLLAFESEVNALLDWLVRLRALQQGMTQQLLTGRIRLK